MREYPGVFIALVFSAVLAVGSLLHSVFPEREARASITCSAPEVPHLQAQSAAIVDFETGTLMFEKNGSLQMPLASLTKIMTVFASSYILDESSLIAVDREALVVEGDSGLTEGEVWQAKELMDFTLMTSSNDGARMLALKSAEEADETLKDFIARMNNLGRSAGLAQTYFLNDTGLDISPFTAGAYGSAEDMAQLLLHIEVNTPELLEQSGRSSDTYTSVSGVEHAVAHTSSIAGILPGSVAYKTGFTDLAGGNLIAIVEPVLGRPVAIAVLGSDRDGRDKDVSALYSYTKEVLQRATLCR